MHQVVPPPFGFLDHEQHKSEYPPSHHHGSGSHFSHIRSGQHTPALHRITTSFNRLHAHDQAEHSLRRKTPRGTIDNGYDGSLTHLVSGPPPLKHMIVPAASSQIHPAAVAQGHPNQPVVGLLQPQQPQQQPSVGPWAYPAAVPTAQIGHGIESMNGPQGVSGRWMVQAPHPALESNVGDRVTYQSPMPQHNYYTLSGMQPSYGPGYQQPLPQTVYSPSGYGGAFSYQAMVPLANNYTPQNSIGSAFMGPQSMLHHGLLNAPGLGQPHHYGLPVPSHPLDDGFARYGYNNQMGRNPSHHGRNSVSMTPTGVGIGTTNLAAGEVPSPARFKERALQSAHKAYSELLSYLTHIKKPQHGRSGSTSRPSSKIMMYPTPATSGSTVQPPVPPLGDPTANYMQQMAQNEAAARMFGQSFYQRGYHEAGTPILNARASLSVLSTLCEQSGWKWVEGMLLGGCLHYGLECYEKALEWFRRIENLDPSHVESISNIAAALYCLNRPDEAEQQWRRAIKLRPTYLEAVEHLVSLLCSLNRSPEAVKAVEYVQRCLKVPSGLDAPREQASETASEADIASPMTLAESTADTYVLDIDNIDSPEQRFAMATEDRKAPGFGSSGYRIPGSENGRMVQLIHAKGNMLYNLKDIDRASEAFEEVVMMSAGKQIQGVKSLIKRIQTVLAPRDPVSGQRLVSLQESLSAPLLLLPEKAKLTAQYVFAPTGGQLPGLQHVVDNYYKRNAVATTSNSLLSLAKIYQDAMSNGGQSSGLARPSAGVGDILSLYYLSLSLQESPSTANNVGILLAGVQQTAPAQFRSVSDMTLMASVPGIPPGSGLSLAFAYYQYGLTLDPKHVHLHTNLGSLLKDIGQLDMAISMYEQAVACDGSFDIALTNLANAVKDRGRVSDAIKYYQRAVIANPDFAEAVCGLSTALNSVCDWRGRGGVLLAGGKYDRWHVDEKGMLQDAKGQGQGSGLMKRVVEIVGRQLKESSTWGCGALHEQSILQLANELRDAGTAATDPFLDVGAELRKWAGRPGEGYRILRLIERATVAAMRTWYQDKHFHGTPSPTGYRRPKLPTSLSVPSAPTVLPFHTFTCPLPAKEVRLISQRNALRISFSTLRSPWIPPIVYPPPDPPSPQLNVGYVSSDFNNHPLAHLMQSVFGMHNPGRVKAICYATTASDKSIHRQKIEKDAPVFHDASSWSPDRLVRQIVEDKIHILVNLNGYTRGARNEIFAARPAPIQMSFMGFAGTLGAEWCDYLLADATAIPPSTLRPHRNNLTLGDVFRDEADADAEDWIYSENIVFCRDTFFCCDHAQSADGHDEREMTWEQDQQRRWEMRKSMFGNLPDDAIILGNFNQLYKIDPTTFRSWLRILAACPKAYLWLLRFPDLGETNLRRTAREWSGEGVASRIIFTDVAPKLKHIARARICDLFLDTPECNAHTTAADILWSNTPLLTLPRYEYKMCSRMAASILKGALPKGPEGERAASELIARNEAEYEEFAVQLINGMTYHPARAVRPGPGSEPGTNTVIHYREGVGRLAELRKLLFESKWTCALFDTRRWVRDLEEAYEIAWGRWERGEGGDIYL
ncbi:glycosyltransferase [Dichotomopilus funicola]|uniref:protein O-GlcNAc transferase n=1 Tax=Dichotomopilus funicola TaxID=1934379 RepID=A0AAN6V918_9PEZI|nr:glycosyltransferase [Dichotomopilus funicola]